MFSTQFVLLVYFYIVIYIPHMQRHHFQESSGIFFLGLK
jgi:hypothetical protein